MSEMLTEEDLEDSEENVLGLKDQVFGLEHLIREKDEEIDQLKKLLARSWRYDEATDCFIRPLREND